MRTDLCCLALYLKQALFKGVQLVNRAFKLLNSNAFR